MAGVPALNLTEAQEAKQQELLSSLKHHQIRQMALKLKLDHNLAMIRPIDWLAGWIAQKQDSEGGGDAAEPSKKDKAAARAAAKKKKDGGNGKGKGGGKGKGSGKGKPKDEEAGGEDEAAAAVAEVIQELQVTTGDLVNRVDGIGTAVAETQTLVQQLGSELAESKACAYHLYCLLSEEPAPFSQFVEMSVSLAEASDSEDEGDEGND